MILSHRSSMGVLAASNSKHELEVTGYSYS